MTAVAVVAVTVVVAAAYLEYECRVRARGPLIHAGGRELLALVSCYDDIDGLSHIFNFAL